MKKNELHLAIFGEEPEKESYKFEQHNFSGIIAGKPYCMKCGLIGFNNKFSQWAIDKGCSNKYHPQHETMRKKTIHH